MATCEILMQDRKSQEGGGKTLTDTSRNNDGSNEAIRKILEGKPFIFPVCDKGHSSRNGLKHHYKKHQNGSENKTYYCHEYFETIKSTLTFVVVVSEMAVENEESG
ncbi:Hypothetical predicted protein [Paramuricea clavata]|uniref:Uncharacterized protein n=1 Tax=Paramuricea clavata TaxID=317549 RepID=A0A7D9HX39_PARCT|nr:Hypothetical predicted protein [Paramuricea clavata]